MDPLIVELSRQGLGFVLLILVTFAYLRKDKQLSDCLQQRVEDNNRLSVVIEATNTAARALEAASNTRSKVIETLGESVQAVVHAIRTQESEVNRGIAAVEANKAMLLNLSARLDALQREVERIGGERSRR